MAIEPHCLFGRCVAVFPDILKEADFRCGPKKRALKLAGDTHSCPLPGADRTSASKVKMTTIHRMRKESSAILLIAIASVVIGLVISYLDLLPWSFLEATSILLLLFLAVLPFLLGYYSRSFDPFEPVYLFCLATIVSFVIAPTLLLARGDIVNSGISFRNEAVEAILLSGLALFGFYVGYYLLRNRRLNEKPKDPSAGKPELILEHYVRRWAFAGLLVAIVLLIIWFRLVDIPLGLLNALAEDSYYGILWAMAETNILYLFMARVSLPALLLLAYPVLKSIRWQRVAVGSLWLLSLIFFFGERQPGDYVPFASGDCCLLLPDQETPAGRSNDLNHSGHLLPSGRWLSRPPLSSLCRYKPNGSRYWHNHRDRRAGLDGRRRGNWHDDPATCLSRESRLYLWSGFRGTIIYAHPKSSLAWKTHHSGRAKPGRALCAPLACAAHIRTFLCRLWYSWRHAEHGHLWRFVGLDLLNVAPAAGRFYLPGPASRLVKLDVGALSSRWGQLGHGEYRLLLGSYSTCYSVSQDESTNLRKKNRKQIGREVDEGHFTSR